MKEKYYKTLGLPYNASLNDIKKAYRKKAKLLHPDINKAANSEEQFVELHEAYSFLTQKRPVYRNQPNSQRNNKSNWDIKKERARNQAKAHAHMKYQEFLKSDIYKTSQSLDVFGDSVGALFLLTVLVAFPIFLYFQEGVYALLFILVLLLLTIKLWKPLLFGENRLFKVSEFFTAINHLRKLQVFQIGIFALSNILVLTQIGFNTIIDITHLLLAYLIGIGVGVAISTAKKDPLFKKMMILGVGPGIISLLLLINYNITTNEKVEVYPVRFETKRSRNHSPLIVLPDNLYENNTNARFFFDMFEGKSDTISYSFAEGFFGYRVIKDHEFTLSTP